MRMTTTTTTTTTALCPKCRWFCVTALFDGRLSFWTFHSVCAPVFDRQTDVDTAEKRGISGGSSGHMTGSLISFLSFFSFLCFLYSASFFPLKTEREVRWKFWCLVSSSGTAELCVALYNPASCFSLCLFYYATLFLYLGWLMICCLYQAELSLRTELCPLIPTHGPCWIWSCDCTTVSCSIWIHNYLFLMEECVQAM